MKSVKKQSIVIKLIKNTQIFFFKNSLIIKGSKGVIAYSKFKDQQKYEVILNKNFIVISLNSSISKNKSRLSKLSNLFQNLIFGVHFFFSKKLLLIGIGLKAWIKTLKSNQKVLLIKAGFSEDLSIIIPSSILIFSLRPTLLLMRSLSKEKVSQFSSLVRAHKKPEKYKGIGIQYQNEFILLKPGKKN